MTKLQFKKRWESNSDGGGITFDDIVDCAQKWGIFARPRIQPIDLVRYRVLLAANVKDAEEFRPNESF